MLWQVSRHWMYVAEVCPFFCVRVSGFDECQGRETQAFTFYNAWVNAGKFAY